ncbi:MAG: alpha/beta hydrolase fold domain-containing protein [Alphaproteobacteria bacterium]|nr:alpha/beta hydrolase fold domain-containing protein [Alphaproteobacteria bacterium]
MPSETANNPHALIDPQQAEALARNAEIVADLGGPGETIAENRERAEAARTVWNQGGPVMAVNEARTIPGPFRDVPVQFYKPDDEGDLPVFVYLHGGGFRIGGPRTNDLQMRQLADDWRGAVISADYLHVPEHTFPDPVDEIVAVLEWIAANGAKWGLDGTRIAVGGASAGASVALGSALTLRDKGRGDLLRAVASLYGVLDYNLESDSMNELGGGDFMLTNAYTQMVYDGYVTDPADRADPRAFAIHADPAGLPPILIEAAQLDPIRDDSLNFAKMLTEAGHPHELEVYAGVLHAYFGYSGVIDEARRSVADLAVFLDKHLGGR